MTLNELTADQRLVLKQRILDDKLIGGASYGELAQADELITDGELEAVYGGTDFVAEDF